MRTIDSIKVQLSCVARPRNTSNSGSGRVGFKPRPLDKEALVHLSLTRLFSTESKSNFAKPNISEGCLYSNL